MTFLFDAEHKKLINWLYKIKVDGGYYVTNDEELYEHYRKILDGVA